LAEIFPKSLRRVFFCAETKGRKKLFRGENFSNRKLATKVWQVLLPPETRLLFESTLSYQDLSD
jgi:hypothetical protein